MEAGSQLGNYVIKDRLGRGATAEVFRALQPAIDRDVAIKVMFPHLTDSADFSARFQREARAMGQLQHPNIGRIIDFEATGERPYMVMEHLDGGSLQELMQATNGPLPIKFALQVTRQLADALRYAHGMGMVHRDIKPANVMFSDDTHECAMLMDFGMARLVDESMTATGAILGTPAFMAPEQMRGEVVGAPADMYSLGVMLYEMVTGRPLYEADSIHTLMMKHVEAPVPSARDSAANVSQELDSLLHTTLAKQPADRFSNAGEMVAAIDHLLGSSTLTGAGGSRATIVHAPGAGSPAGSAGGSEPPGRSRGVLIGAAALAIAAIAGGSIFALSRGGDPVAVDVAAANEAPTVAPEPDTGAAEPTEVDQTTQAVEDAAQTLVDEEPPPPSPVPFDPRADLLAGFDPAVRRTFFPTSAQMDGDEFVLAWDRSRPAPVLFETAPPRSAEYRASIDTASEPIGVISVDGDGRGTMRAGVPAYLATTFSIETVDPTTGETVEVVYENAMAPELRAAFDQRLAIIANAQRELAIAVDHRGFIGDELSNGDLEAARRHTEHVINIIDGNNGSLFGDLDGSGLAENPGDGVGILGHLASNAASSFMPADVLPYEQRVSLAFEAFTQAQQSGVQLLSSDSVDEAGGAFDGLSERLAAAAAGIEAAEVALHNQALAALVGTDLGLTGTPTSVGTIAALPSTGQVVISTTLATTGQRVDLQSNGGDLTMAATGFVVVDAPGGFGEFGEVSLIDENGEPVATGSLDATALGVHEQLTTDRTGVIALLNGQAQLVIDHADLMDREVAAGNHGEVRRHAEHVVNMIVGEQGETFGDLDGDGAAQNPGDGVGVLIYLDQVDALLDELPTATIEQQFHRAAYRRSIDNIRGLVLNAQAESLRILATDSAPEAEAPMVSVVSDITAALDGGDTDSSGSVDLDETGIRTLADRAAFLLSAPLEPR